MGDRGNIAVSQGDGTFVYLYTHWDGYGLKDTLKRALKKGWRWNDAPYLARIIFEEMIKGNEGTETGYGISTMETDRNHPTIFVDPDLQEIRIETKRWSFSEFVDDLYQSSV